MSTRTEGDVADPFQPGGPDASGTDRRSPAPPDPPPTPPPAPWLSVEQLESASRGRLLRLSLGVVACYLAFAMAFYSYSKGWDAVDAAYFAVVTLTTVGYGDLHPDTDSEKLVGVLLAFVAVSFIATAVGLVCDDFSAKTIARAEKVVIGPPVAIAAELVGALCLIVVAGAVPFAYLEGARWIDAVYWAGITMATVGYGDSCPKTHAGRLFAVFYMFFGTLLTARALSKLARLPMELRHQRLEETVEHQFGTTLSRLQLRSITRQIADLNLRPHGEGIQEVSKSEFTLAMLLKLGRITEADLQECTDTFAQLDSSQDGYLGQADVATLRALQRPDSHPDAG